MDTARRTTSIRIKLLFLFLFLAAIATFWLSMRPWLLTQFHLPTNFNDLLDVGVISIAGIVAVILLTRWISRPVASYVGPTQINAVKLLFQIVGLSLIILIIFSITGASVFSALVGVGFFSIVIGLAAQSVLGNLLSGIMLMLSRPFHINDRIAIITWQYGKFPPTLPHGWLEPSHTGVVKGIALTYTKILADSEAMLKIPNALVTQSLIMNLSHGKHTHVGTQFEVPISVEPDELHKKLMSRLSKTEEFRGQEERFEIIEMSPASYLVTVIYRVERGREQETKSLLFKTIRIALLDCSKMRRNAQQIEGSQIRK